MDNADIGAFRPVRHIRSEGGNVGGSLSHRIDGNPRLSPKQMHIVRRIGGTAVNRLIHATRFRDRVPICHFFRLHTVERKKIAVGTGIELFESADSFERPFDFFIGDEPISTAEVTGNEYNFATERSDLFTRSHDQRGTGNGNGWQCVAAGVRKDGRGSRIGIVD